MRPQSIRQNLLWTRPAAISISASADGAKASTATTERRRRRGPEHGSGLHGRRGSVSLQGSRRRADRSLAGPRDNRIGRAADRPHGTRRVEGIGWQRFGALTLFDIVGCEKGMRGRRSLFGERLVWAWSFLQGPFDVARVILVEAYMTLVEVRAPLVGPVWHLADFGLAGCCMGRST
jgi:hypothetical protein